MLGVATLKACLEEDIEIIYAVIRCNSKNADRIPKHKKVKVVECDVTEYASLPEKIEDTCDTFYHFAWEGTGEGRNKKIAIQAHNINYTLDALYAAKELGCSKFIASGSQAEYGVLDMERISPDTPVNPIQPYGIAKYAAGQLVLRAAEQLEITAIWVRVFSVYGKFDKASTMISSTITKLQQGIEPVFTPAEQRWDYLHCDDAGKAFYLMGQKTDKSKIYCLGSGKTKHLHEYIRTVQRVVNPDVAVHIGGMEYPKNCVMNLCADISDLEKDLGWQPKIEFEDGIKSILE